MKYTEKKLRKTIKRLSKYGIFKSEDELMEITEKQARETIKCLSKPGKSRYEYELLEAAVQLACIKRFKSDGRHIHAEEIYRRLCINRFMPRHDTRELMKRLISCGEWDSLYIVFCWGAFPELSPCSSTPWEN